MSFVNWAPIIILRRKFFGKKKIVRWEKRYSKNIKDKSAENYVLNKSKKWMGTLNVVTTLTPQNGKILETGCGTSALSIWLNKNGYQNYCIDKNNKILKIAKKLNREIKTKVDYKKENLFRTRFKNNFFDTVFSQGVIEHLDLEKIPVAINEGLRISKTYIFAVPTICDLSDCLRGDENLLNYFQWKKIIRKSNGYIFDSFAYFPFHPMIEKINQKIFKSKLLSIAPTLIFVIKSKLQA